MPKEFDTAADGLADTRSDELVKTRIDDVRDTDKDRPTLPESLVKLPYDPAEVFGSIDDYDLLGEIGHGGMGIVYKAFARRLGRYVALKVIRSGGSATEIEEARFVNEAMLAARLKHPNIVGIFDSGKTDSGLSYFVMEFVEGKSLGQWIERGLVASPAPGRLTVRVAVEAVEKAASALHYAHEQGVVHRDVKPDNILLDAAFEPHVSDFGIAKNSREDAPALTTAGSALGSPQYMSPEQVNGELTAMGPRTDVYALGATLYHVLAGRPIFEGDSAVVVMHQILTAEPDRPSLVAQSSGLPAVPLDLETVCLKAAEKESARRYATAAAVAADLRRFLDGEPILARPVGALERLRKRLRKNRPLFVGAFVAATILLTLGAAFAASLLTSMRRSSTSLRELDHEQAVAQAGTLERSIRVNMLQGRADLARELVSELTRQPEVGEIRVYRTDRTPAYADARTRRKVEQRLGRSEVRGLVEKKYPDMLPTIEVLRSMAFPRIDKPATWDSGGDTDVDDDAWRRALESGATQSYLEGDDTSGRLVVLKPIENSERCQICHGGKDDYGDNRVRAVLVVKRPQGRVGQLIAANRHTTLIIAGVSIVVLLGAAFVTARVFGIDLRKREFGA